MAFCPIMKEECRSDCAWRAGAFCGVMIQLESISTNLEPSALDRDPLPVVRVDYEAYRRWSRRNR